MYGQEKSSIESRDDITFRWDFSFSRRCENPREKLITVSDTERALVGGGESYFKRLKMGLEINITAKNIWTTFSSETIFDCIENCVWEKWFQSFIPVFLPLIRV